MKSTQYKRAGRQENAAARFSRCENQPAWLTVTKRELEFVRLVVQGFQNKEIGEQLFISHNTVKHHLHSVFFKLGIADRLELVLYSIYKGLHIKTETRPVLFHEEGVRNQWNIMESSPLCS